MYAAEHGYPCIFTRPLPPFIFDGLTSPIQEMDTKLEVWQKYLVALSLNGQAPFSDKCVSITIEEDNTLKVITSGSRLARIKFENLIIFDDYNITGLPFKKGTTNEKNKVLDWFHVRSGMEHNYDVIETGDDFIGTIIFYPSNRFGNQKTDRVRKDLVAISYLEDDQLSDFDFSDTMARFKITKIMKDHGIRGARNGKDPNNPDKYKYYSVKIESADREMISNNINLYEDTDNIKFMQNKSYDISVHKPVDNIIKILNVLKGNTIEENYL